MTGEARASASALAYHLTEEQAEPDEAASIAAINKDMRGILETTFADYGHPCRSVHAKSHGLLQGKLQVLGDLPDGLAQGMFATPGRYPVVLRFSTNPGDILDDTVSSPRGVALKVIGVAGERLPGSEGDVTQDFIMVNGPAFVAPNAKGFSGSLHMLAATTDTGQAWKKGLSKLLRGAVRALSLVGKDAGPLKALGGQPLTHPLGETFYSQTPFRYGRNVAKFCLAPAMPELVALKDAPVDLAGRPNGLRAALIDHFAVHGGVWELRVQLRTDPETMPIEDASVPWPEHESPYVPVARITVPRQTAWNEARARQVDDAMSFSPWHGIVDHQPLGSINRARKQAYAMSARFRGTHARCPMHEPTVAVSLSDEAPSVYGSTPGREGRRPNTPDAVAGKLGQPLNATARRLLSGGAGGLVAGTLLSFALVGIETAFAAPPELVALKRRAGAKATGRRVSRSKASGGEQAVVHAGHLALSAVVGAAYGAAKPASASPLVAGTVFGAAFYGLAHGALGPLLGVTPTLSKGTSSSVARHGLFHLMFGITTAVVADRVAKRL